VKFTTRSKRLVWTVAIIASGMVVLAYVAPRPFEPGITWDNYCRIQFGQTRAEVENLLGGPPGDFQVDYPLLKITAAEPAVGDDGEWFWYESESWATDNGEILVAFDSSQRVRGKLWQKPQYGTKGSIQYRFWRAKFWWDDWWAERRRGVDESETQ
jgi:hypothetical protein